MHDPKPIRVSDFLAWEARQTNNHELIDGAIVAISTPTKAHGRLVRRLNRTIDAAAGEDCDVYLGDMTVRIDGLERDNAPRPDIVVTCDERDRRPHDEDDRTISWPKLVVEVLSPRTAAMDLVSKLRSYFSIPSIEKYLIVDSRSRNVSLHRRAAAQVVTTWPADRISLTSVPCEYRSIASTTGSAGGRAPDRHRPHLVASVLRTASGPSRVRACCCAKHLAYASKVSNEERETVRRARPACMTAVIGGLHVTISDADLQRISEANPGWQFERADDGSLLVSPTSTPGGAKSAEALVQLSAYAKQAGGKVYDAATGFKTPRGGVVSPDAAWVSAEHVARHSDSEGFWQMMPDVVVEIASKSDSWTNVQLKIDKYVSDGAGYAIAIDPQTREVYERGDCPNGLTLDVIAIVDA